MEVDDDEDAYDPEPEQEAPRRQTRTTDSDYEGNDTEAEQESAMTCVTPFIACLAQPWFREYAFRFSVAVVDSCTRSSGYWRFAREAN